MDAVKLLKEFAKSQGINELKVDEFLASFGKPKTLDELMELPHDLLNHIDYISYIDNPLKAFIKDEMWTERYMTIELERVVDCLRDRKWYLVRDIIESDSDYDDIDFDNLVIEDDEIKKSLEKLLEVEKHVIDIKFGSVVYDW